jgi:hypothetical protein
MSAKPKSKLRTMAEAGDPWAIKTLAEAQERGRQAGLRGAAMQRASAAPAKDPAFAEAMRSAMDIRQWTDGPNRPPWRVYRLAQALTERHG